MGSDQVTFSVIIPSYNRVKSLSEAVESVLAQEFSDFELIIVDDGSVDTTQDYLHSLDDDRIITYHQENEGRCRARNKGIESARGRYLCFLDSDDIYYPNHLSTLNELIESSPAYSVWCTEQEVNGGLKPYPSPRFNGRCVVRFRDFIRHNPIQLNQICIRAEECPRFPDERIPISEDWIFMRKLTLAHDILKTETPTTDIRIHSENTMGNTAVEEMTRWNLYAAELFCKDERVTSDIRGRIMSFTHLLTANMFLNEGLEQAGKVQLKKSWKYFPYNLQPLMFNAIKKLLF